MHKAQVAQRFKTIYARALTDVENGKPKAWAQKDTDYNQVRRFINDLAQAKDFASLDICIAEYLKIYRNYSPDDRRSKMTFFHLLNSRIDLSAPDDKYLAKLSLELSSAQQPFTPTRQRFDGLEDDQRRQISKLLKRQEILNKEHASIFDELREAYEKSGGSRKPSTAQLYAFDPLQDPGLEKALRALMTQSIQAWGKCEKELSKQNWDEFSQKFAAFTDFLKQNRNEKLKLFQILKLCRDPLVGKSRKVRSGGRPHVETGPLEEEFYFQAMYALFMRAVLLVNPVTYQYGFPTSEEGFLLDPLAETYYFSNYRNRLRQGASNAAGFPGTSLSFLWLLLFSRSKDLWLINDQKFLEIAKIYDAVIKVSGKTPQRQHASNPRTFSTRGKSTWDFAKGTFKIGDKLGAGQSETEIAYFEGENTRDPRIFLEFTQMRGPLFEVNLDQFLKCVEATPYQLIWEANKGLLRLIAEYFGFLFTVFFPGVGYFGVFLELGFTGVLRQVVEQELLDQIIDQLSEHSALSGGAGGPGPGGFDWLSVLLSGRKAGSNLAKKLEREALNEARADARLLEGKTTQLLGPGETDASRLVGDDLKTLDPAGDRMLQDKPTSWKPLPVVGERQAVRAEATAAKGTSHDVLDRKAISTDVPAVTRRDLDLAEQNLRDATERFKAASETLKNANMRAGDLEDLVKEAEGKPNSGRLKQALSDAEEKVENARARYKGRKYELQAAESKAKRLTDELAKRGELQPELRIEWNLPAKPIDFRYKSVEAKSWRPEGYVGATDDRKIVERILNEDPNGELGKHLLQNGELFPTKVGDMNYWKAHPELIEMAHVLSKREGGLNVYIIMTKARNRIFQANLEHTGGVFKEDAIVIQGVAIDRLSAIELGVPQAVIDRAPVIQFAK